MLKRGVRSLAELDTAERRELEASNASFGDVDQDVLLANLEFQASGEISIGVLEHA